MKRLILLVVLAVGCGRETETEPEAFDPCMPGAQNKVMRLYGPWGGLRDRETDATTADFAGSFNVEVEGREIRSRRGRIPYMKVSTLSRCGQVVFSGRSATRDVTDLMSDGQESSAIAFVDADSRFYNSGSHTLYVGAPVPFGSVSFVLSTANTNLASGLSVRVLYPNGTAYGTATIASDATSKMSTAGALSFTIPSGAWVKGLYTQYLRPVENGEFNPDFYYVAIDMVAANPATDLPTDVSIAEVDIADLALDPAYLQPQGSLLKTSGGLLFGGKQWAATFAQSANYRWRFSDSTDPWWWLNWDTDIIGAAGSAPVVLRDGKASRLAAVPGQDKDVTGYLSSLPDTDAMASYRARLYLASGKTVYFSELNNALNIIPFDGSAPQRGANVWPAANNFDVSDDVVGMTVFGDRLVIATQSSLEVWDGYARQRVPGAPGCVAGHSLAETRRGLAYLAADGVYLFDGNSTRRISEPVSRLLERVSSGAVSGAVGVTYAARRQYRLYVPVNGQPHNTLCLAWDYDNDRWHPLGGTPPWLSANSRFREMEVAAACVDGDSLYTVDYAGNVWLEDRGFTDGGYPIPWAIAFKRLGLGEDEGVHMWRNVRVSAKSTGAPLKLAMLVDGDELSGSVLAGSELLEPVASTVVTLTPGQATWTSNATVPEELADELPTDLGGVIERDAFGSVPASVWRSFPIPHARVARTVQPVLYCDGMSADGVRRGTAAAIRGIEVEFRPKAGRRSLA